MTDAIISSMPFDQVMELTSTVSSPTAFSLVECRALYDVCVGLNAQSTIVEIGCQLGRTSSIIAQVGRAVGYHSIHIDPYTEQLEYLAPWIAMMHKIGNPFTFHCMRSDQVDFRRNADVLLVDGDHTEHGVEADCLIADLRVKKGGLLLAHDYGRETLPDVALVLNRCINGTNGWKLLGHYDTLRVWERRERLI